MIIEINAENMFNCNTTVVYVLRSIYIIAEGAPLGFTVLAARLKSAVQSVAPSDHNGGCLAYFSPTRGEEVRMVFFPVHM